MRTVVSDIEDAMVISGSIGKELKRESNEEKIPRTSPALCDMTSYLRWYASSNVYGCFIVHM